MKSREEKNKEKQQHFDNIEKREIRKKRFIKFLKIFSLLFVIMMLSTLYTKYISTLGIIVKEDEIKNKKLPESFSGTKLIQFSDLHYGSTIFIDEVKSLVKTINERKPDIIVFTGDLINEKYKLKTEEQERLTKELNKLDATIGKYAISGEEDERDEFLSILNQCNFTVLDNTSDVIYSENKDTITIIGISSKEINQNIENAFNNTNPNNYTIALTHEPDTTDEILENHKPDLILSGHSHNGQIKIPYLPTIIRKSNSLKYPDEYYKIDNTKLFVSSGIGCSDFNFRLGARPSINFFRLRK